MAIFGAYETTEELERTPFSAVFKATQADGKTRSIFIVKSLDLDETLDPQTLDAKNQQFLSAVRTQQKISDRNGTCHWAPVHDVGTVRGRAFYVTDYYPRTVAGMIKGRVKVSARALYSLVRGVVVALKELNQYCRRPHGNLKAPNILIADPDLDPTEIYLADPLSDEHLPQSGADAADMKALGHLIYQLVTHRPFPQIGGWPVQMSPEWQRLGRRGRDWLAFCNALLDPLTEKPMTLDDASAALKKLHHRALFSPRRVVTAALAGAVIIGAFAAYKFIQQGGLANRASAESKPADRTPPEARAALQFSREIDIHLAEIEKRRPILEASRDPLLARFSSLLQTTSTEAPAERKQRLAELDALSGNLVAFLEKDYPTVDRVYFNREAKIHQETKDKTTLTPDDFARWLAEVKDPQFTRLDEKLDPRKAWQPYPVLRRARTRLDELSQMAPQAAEVPKTEADELAQAITQTRERRWNSAQKPLIEQEIKSIDARLAKVSSDLDTSITSLRSADTRLAQLRAKLAANALILTDDSLQARWNQSRQQILEDLKKDSARIDDLSKRTTDLQTRLTQIDQGFTESSRLAQQNDFINAIDKLDGLILSYPDEAALRTRRADFAAPLHDRGVKYANGDGVAADANESFKCLLLSAGLGDARAARMLGRIAPQTGAASKDTPALLSLFRRSAEAGDAASMNILGFMYENGWGTTADTKLAIDWYTKSANAGFGGAMNNLGFLYSSGRGVKQDSKQAFDWFKKGAEAGYVTSMKNLGAMYKNGEGVAKDATQAINWYRKAADGGDVRAMSELASFYEHGELVPRNLEEAARWHRKAAESGDAHAMVTLGMILEGGEVVARNEAEAFNWYTKAAAAGENTALTHLGNMYEEGRGVAKDEARAFQLYQQALSRPDPNASFFLARMYESGRGTAKNDVKAFELYSTAALVHPSAMYSLGMMHSEGRGTKKDAKKALELFKRAAEHEEPMAMKELGLMYLRGEGVEKNPAEAAKWMTKSAEAGDPAAMSNVGVMYLNGQGVTKDEKKAMEWFRKAADAGNAGAMANLGVMYKNGRGVARDVFEAFEWYRKAAEAKDTLAMNNLALMYQKGEGTKRDYNQALTWFKAAADAGDASAMNNLGVMYELGQGVARNPAEAARWFKMAADAGENAGRKNFERVQKGAPGATPPSRRDRIGRTAP